MKGCLCSNEGWIELFECSCKHIDSLRLAAFGESVPAPTRKVNLIERDIRRSFVGLIIWQENAGSVECSHAFGSLTVCG